MQYKVSVIIPTYNAEKFLEQAIDSIKNQTLGFENIELIIVDDNSNDKTREILREYSNNYPNIKSYFPEGSSGSPSRGRNIGIDKASSDYIMFLDQDDRYALNMCEVLYDVINKTESDMVMSNIKYIKNNQFLDNDICQYDKFSYEVVDPKDNMDIFLRNYMWDKIFKLDFLKEFKIKCLEGLFYEDIFFTIKCYLNSDKVVFLENFYGYEYNMRDSSEDSSTSNNITEDFFKKSIKPYYPICDFFKENGRQDLLNWFFENWFVQIIGHFSILNIGYNRKLIYSEELYNISVYSGFRGHLGELWADIIFQNILKRNFFIAIIFSKIINILFASYSLRRIYRKVYKKEYA